MTLATAVVMLPTGSTAPAAEPLFHEGFESLHQPGPRWRTSGIASAERRTDWVRAGRASLRLAIDRAEFPSGFRAELRELHRYTEKDEYWFGLSIGLPADWQRSASWDVVLQWHGTPDKDLGERSRRPVLALIVDGDEWRLGTRWDDRRVTPSGDTTDARYRGSRFVSLGAAEAGRWTDWVFRIRWAFEEDGLIGVWRDGHQVAAIEGPNSFNDALGPYLKFGLYKAAWNPKSRVHTPEPAIRVRAVFVDELRVARGPHGLKLVAPWHADSPSSFARQ